MLNYSQRRGIISGRIRQPKMNINTAQKQHNTVKTARPGNRSYLDWRLLMSVVNRAGFLFSRLDAK